MMIKFCYGIARNIYLYFSFRQKTILMTNNKLEIGSIISALQINNDKVSTKFLYVKCLIKKKK